jgi:gliding motility-associated-like protein
MKIIIVLFLSVVLLSSCSKDEFEPHQLYNYTDTTFVIDTSQINDICLYPYDSIFLDATVSDTTASYLWFPYGLTTPVIKVDEYMYQIILTISTSSSFKTVYINVENCKPYFFYPPNSFTPNDDYLNDFWRPTFGGPSKNYTSIYYEVRDNEGVKLFSTNEIQSDGWNGKYKGVPMPSGFYLYYINYSTLTTENNILTGSLELIR